jgi:hypothetical protein
VYGRARDQILQTPHSFAFLVRHHGDDPAETCDKKGKNASPTVVKGAPAMTYEKKRNSERLEGVMLLDLFELPFAGFRLSWGTLRGKESEESLRQAYDGLVGAVSDSINAWYSNDFVSEIVAQSFTGFLQWQRLSRAFTGAVFAGLLPAMGLPTSNEIREVRRDLAEMRNEIRFAQTLVDRREHHHLSLDREGHVESAPAGRNQLRTRTPAAA